MAMRVADCSVDICCTNDFKLPISRFKPPTCIAAAHVKTTVKRAAVVTTAANTLGEGVVRYQGTMAYTFLVSTFHSHSYVARRAQ